MLGLESQNKLKEFFQTVAESELQVERQRQHLAGIVDFEPYAAFTRFDRNVNNKVNDLEIYQYLRDNNVNYVTLSDCTLVVKYFDLDNDGYLSYQEFMQLLLPCDDMLLRSTATQRPTYTVGRFDRLPYVVEKELTNLLEKEISYHQRVERLKQELHQRYDWTNRAAFETVDVTRDYNLNNRNIQQFLRLNGFYATESEVVAIIRRLDVDADQKITYDEFIEAVKPQTSSSVFAASSSSGLGASRIEEEKRASSPLRKSGLEGSPMRESRYGGAGGLTSSSASGFLGASNLSTSQYRPGASPSRSYASPSRSSGLGSSQYGEAKRQSPLKQDDEEELVRAFKEQISLEKELEDAKNRLSLQSDFNLTDAFSMIDANNNGWIDKYELVDQLTKLGLYALKDDIALYIRRYDKNSDGRLRFSEFVDSIIPKSSAYASALQARSAYYSRLSYPKTEYFTRETRDLYLKTFKTHFSAEASAEYLRKRLLRRPGFNASDAFSACDSDRNGYITRDELKSIFRDYGFYATDTELSWLIDRYDRNQDGKISYSEFIDEILPKSPTR